MIVASLAGAKVEEVIIDAKNPKDVELRNKVPSQTLPILETDDNKFLGTTASIVNYIASVHKPELLGANAFDQAKVDMWMNIIFTELHPLAHTLGMHVFGQIEVEANEHAYIYGLMKEQVKMINNQLKQKKFFIGDSITTIDIIITLVLTELMQAIMDTNLRNSLNNMNAHFDLISQMDCFKQRMGLIKRGKKQVPLTLMSVVEQEAAKAAAKAA